MHITVSPGQVHTSSYVGHEHLVAMRAARRYNAMIESLIDRWMWDRVLVLDIGAGIGEFTQRMINRGYDTLAFEPDGVQAQSIRDQGMRCVERLSECYPESFDGAYSLNVLEHIEDDVSALREWSAVLRPGGVLFLYVPAFPALYSAMDRAVGHYRRYTRESLEAVVRQAGLTVLRSGYADSLGFAASVLLRWHGGDGSISPNMVRLYDRLIFPVSRVLDVVLSPLFGKNVWLAAVKSPMPPCGS